MKRWNIHGEYQEGEDLILQLLKNRGIDNINDFLFTPNFSEYFNRFPSDFKQSLKNAKEIINEALVENRLIVIFGDYDADGICSTAILYKTIKDELNFQNVSYFIPNRFIHGYGISKGAIDEILSGLPSEKVLFITVDTGITAVDEVQYIKDLGHQIIITDHHQKPAVIPSADCIIWSDKMVGATISFLLSRVLGSKDSQSIALAAIATVTDLQQILDFNRAIVKQGLKVLNSNPPAGIKALIQIAGKNNVEIDTYDLGWVIGPRLNASGRLVDASDSLKLFIEKDPQKIEESAFKLNQLNSDRQDKTTEMYQLATVTSEGSLPKLLFSESNDYHEGIIGLVAAKISQKYYRPAIVISLSEDQGKGSVRSVKGIDIISLLRRHSDLFLNLGGHPMAAGFTIKKENIEDLKSRMLEDSEKMIDDLLLIPELDIDMEIPISKVTSDLLLRVEGLKPFGLGNEEPVFLSKNLKIADTSIVGKDGRHLKIKFYDNGNYYKGIYFGGAEENLVLPMGTSVDVVYSLKKNDYNGNISVDLMIRDLKVS